MSGSFIKPLRSEDMNRGYITAGEAGLIVFLASTAIIVIAIFIEYSNVKSTIIKQETTVASPRNDQQYIRTDVETGRIKCAVELDSNGKCSEWIIYKTIKE